MSLRNIIVALLVPVALAGCGFEPIAAIPSGIGEKDVVISDLDIASSDRRFAYRLRKEILRSVRIDAAAEQSLRLTSTIEREGLAIQQNDTITRQNIIAKTKFALAKKPAAGETEPPAPVQGDTTAITAVNATASQFSTRVSDREAVERLAVETARRIVTFLRVNRPS